MVNIPSNKSIFYRLHLDPWLLLGILMLMGVSLTVLYSVDGYELVERQLVRLAIALGTMFFLAQFSPDFYQRWSPFIFSVCVLLLIAVLIFGHTGKGAQRWLDLGFTKFQPSEIMKLIMPLMIAYYISQDTLPPKFKNIFIAFLLVIIPTLLIAKQPDLGTSILVASAGVFVLFLSGISWLYIFIAGAALLAFVPILWFFLMHDYQRGRILTLLNPEADPLGAGYHIIQSKIAIGSGGLWGKGWLQGTQSQLEFLPERHTDFIFAVFSEEFGLIGVLLLLALYLFIISRGLWIANQAQDAYTRLVAGSITLTFFVYVFVNIGMVSGILPVVGVPLPLVSYGGTSIVTLLAGFGILMSIHTHKRFNS
ncbi:rod shape-determining protein RodA [Psychromonas sp. CNPT3]|uniref:rod shape-determining protein RodA n=1 Tax=Psychromonas sp. CNPT3 TaxID=314282 RepID=UPI00006E76AF|nr:rod shape-determining protein RodA [Psychromonas sp. CNPT3]AGH80628.1 rod shape-determining protein RodA [Psychromonas sp. CNPT3]